MGLREQILASKDIQYRKINVPEWACDVMLKIWSGAERLKISGLHKIEGTNIAATIVALSCCDEQGIRLFKDEDVNVLAEKSGAALENVSLAAIDFNGINKVEEAKK